MKILAIASCLLLAAGCTKQEAQQSMERIRSAAGVDHRLVVVSDPGYQLNVVVTQLATFPTLLECQSAAVVLAGGVPGGHRVSTRCEPGVAQ
jgi:hypothetical protein